MIYPEALLKQYSHFFPGVDRLHPFQETALSQLSAGKNVLTLVATGAGKSLLYQLQALRNNDLVIVVSPLVALMNEQTSELQSLGYPVAQLNGIISFDEQRKLLKSLGDKNVSLLFLSPERLHNELFRKALIKSGRKISLLAIDEAHCISQWGCDFRPEYAQIHSFDRFLKDQGSTHQVLCLTATLSREGQTDIQRMFEISEEGVVRQTEGLRDNLVLNFIQVNQETEKAAVLEELLRKHELKKTIVYLYSRRECKLYAEEFRSKGWHKTGYYHAGLNDDEKNRVYQEFREGELTLLFSTSAFGMGINIPDIQAVVHMHIPNSVEEYYQQVGRAARKREICPVGFGWMLWSETNFKRRVTWIKKGRIKLERLDDALQFLGIKGFVGEISSIEEKSFRHLDPYNLGLLSYHLEERGYISFAGELHGPPSKVKFKVNPALWDRFYATLDGFDSYAHGAEESGISIQEMIDLVYGQELAGNVTKLPAMSKDLFFNVYKDSIEGQEAEDIVNAINGGIEFRLAQLEQLRLFVDSKNKDDFLRKCLSY